MKTLTLLLSLGWIASVANAWAVPCEKPMYDRLSCCVVSRMYSMVFGISWKANSSIEKSQNSGDVGEQLIDFFEYLLPRLLPN